AALGNIADINSTVDNTKIRGLNFTGTTTGIFDNIRSQVTATQLNRMVIANLYSAGPDASHNNGSAYYDISVSQDSADAFTSFAGKPYGNGRSPWFKAGLTSKFGKGDEYVITYSPTGAAQSNTMYGATQLFGLD